MLVRIVVVLILLNTLLPALQGQESPGSPDQLWLTGGERVEGVFLAVDLNGAVTFRPAAGVVQIYSSEEIGELRIGPSAPEAPPRDRVILRSGAVFTGRIIGNTVPGELELVLKEGSTIKLQMAEVKRLERAASPASSPDRKPAGTVPPKAYDFRERGWYNASYFVGLSGRSAQGLRLGLGAHSTTGYQFNRWLGLGVGLGVDAYSFEAHEIILPVSLGVRGYLTRRRTAPYYSLHTGYGFALKNEQAGYIEAQGGWLVHPAVGLRLGGNPDVNVVFDVGYRFQEARYDRQFEFSGIRERREVTYKRLTFRLGLLF